MTFRRSAAFAFAVLACAATVGRAAPVVIKSIARPNIVAPGTGGAQYNVFNKYPGLDQSGHITFTATTSGIGRQGIWTGDSTGVLSLVALAGSPVPASPGDTFRSSPAFTIDVEQGGPLAYTGNIESPNRRGYWLAPPGGAQELIAQDDTPAPGTLGAAFTSAPSSVAVNVAGQYAFANTLKLGGSVTAANQAGLWANAGGGTKLLARQGAQVPGMAAGVAWQGTFGKPVVQANGAVDFWADLSNGQTGIFRVDVGGAVTAVAISGQGGVGSVTFGPPHVNTGGDVAFYDGAVWLKDAAGLHKVARVGSAIVGGGTLSKVFNTPRVSDDGRVFFMGTVGTGDNGLYSTNAAGVVTPVAVPGQAVPGKPGWTFERIEAVPQVNRLGQVAFQARVRDAAIDVVIVANIFATDTAGVPTFIAGPGTPISLGGGLNATLAITEFYPFGDVDFQQFNDAGQIVFFSTADSGSVIVFATLPAAPEPGAAVVLSVAAAATFARRRRRFDKWRDERDNSRAHE